MKDCTPRVNNGKSEIGLESNLAEIDALLGSGQLKKASRLLSRLERLAVTAEEHRSIMKRVLFHGILVGHFDTTVKLFTEQLVRYPQDENLKLDFHQFREIAGWSLSCDANTGATELNIASKIHECLRFLLHSDAPLVHLQSLAVLSLQGADDSSLPAALANWADLENIILGVAERVLPFRMEALLGEAWLAVPARGSYPRLPHLQDILTEAENVPAFADVVAFLQVLESISRRDIISALENLTTLMAGRSAWLWLRLLDFSAYFGSPKHWKTICLWIQRQERLPQPLQLPPLLPAFAEVVASAVSDTPLLTVKQVASLKKQMLQQSTPLVNLWAAQPETSPVVAGLLSDCILLEEVPLIWTQTMYPALKTGLDFLRAAHRQDFDSLQSAWKQMPDTLRQRSDLRQTVQHLAASVVGNDPPQLEPDLWLDFLPMWKEFRPDLVWPVIDQLKPGPEKDWLRNQYVKLGAYSQAEICSQWLRKRWRDFSETGWAELKRILIDSDPRWGQELEEIALSPQTKKCLRDLEQTYGKKIVSNYDLKNILQAVPAKECLVSRIFAQFVYLLFPPRFQPTSFEDWYSIHALRVYWDRLEPDRRLYALDWLEKQGHSALRRVLNEPLRPLLIDVANIALNAQIVGQGGGDPFTAIERIWAEAWSQGFYPILTYADSSFWSNYRESEIAQKHFDYLVRERRIQIADATGDYRRTADFHILNAIDEEKWQGYASVLTRDHFGKRGDPWAGMFPWLSHDYKKLKMEFEVSVTGQLSLVTSSKQKLDIP